MLAGLSTLRGRRALVTGATRGIGAAVARRLAAEGVDVAVVGRTATEQAGAAGSLESVVRSLRPLPGRVVGVRADLSDPDSRAGIVPEGEELLGGSFDLLVNNAAAAVFAPLADFPLRRRRLVFEVNVHAPLDLAQAVLPAMVGRGEGWIVNVSSATARLRPGPPFVLVPPGTAMAVYGASKAALNRLSNGLAAELDGTGVRVNTIEPRFGVRTPGVDRLLGDPESLSRMESMEEMVEATVALCRVPPDLTGATCVSLDLLERWSLPVRGLDGTERSTS